MELSKGYRDTPRGHKRLALGASADLERSELDIVSFAPISDIDSLNHCGRRTKTYGRFAATIRLRTR